MSLAWQPPDSDERRFVRVGEIPARGDEKRAAAHRRIEDAQRQDLLGRRVAHERAERAPHEVVGDRLRRVERAGGLADAGSAVERDVVPRGRAWPRGRLERRLVVEQRLVHRAELLDAEIAIRDPLAPAAVGGRPRRQRQQRPPRRLVVQIAALGERRAGRARTGVR